MEQNNGVLLQAKAKSGDSTRRQFIKTAGATVSGYLLSGQEGLSDAGGGGTLRVEIREATTKQIVPAMICITSLADGKWRTPPDGRSAPPYTTVKDFMGGFYSWKPGDIGPVRVTNGDYHDNSVRSLAYGDKSSYPFWQEPVAYFVSKPFEIFLPTGKWRLAVAHGIEYHPVFEEFEVNANENRERTIHLHRWVDMARRGWYSGDAHVHAVRLTPAQSKLLLTWARAEDLHVCNILRMGDSNSIGFEQAGYGKNFRYQEDDYVLASGQEDPRIDEQGHMIGLNIQAPVRDVSRYHVCSLVFDGIHAQRGLTGYAHLAWAPEQFRRTGQIYPWDATINVVRGKIDFLEILQFRQRGVEDYYDFLNLGYKLSASAGSDLPWGNTIGEVRTYAYTGSDFSVDTWFAALKEGRTFVTNGPMMELTVDGTPIGGELKVDKHASLRICARAWSPASIGCPKTLEIVSHGDVIQSIEANDPSGEELKVDFSIKAEASQWIAARASSQNGALAHTSPVYVVMGGQSFRNEKELPGLIAKRLKILDYIDSRLDQFSRVEVEALTTDIEDARARYKDLLCSSKQESSEAIRL